MTTAARETIPVHLAMIAATVGEAARVTTMAGDEMATTPIAAPQKTTIVDRVEMITIPGTMAEEVGQVTVNKRVE
jgi:hypothetical protein